MSVREHNLEIISNHLRACYDKRVTTEESLKHMPAAQRVAVLKQETFKRNIRDRFTIKELAEDIPELTYHNIRYALVGAYDIEYRNKKQPQGLAEYGIVVRHYAGKRQPTFSYDPELMYHALVGDVSSITDMSEVASEPKPAAPAESVTSEEVTPEAKVEPCNFKHVPRWVETLLLHGINESRVRIDDNKVMMIDGFPVIGIKYVTADMIEGDIPDDWKPIVYDNDDLVSKDTSTK